MTILELCVRHTADVVRKCKGNRMQSAKQLGISVRTVRNYLHQYAVDYPNEVCKHTCINGTSIYRLEKKIASAKVRLDYQIKKAEMERQRLLDLQDRHQSRLYKVKGA
jgi:hypothetical protein